MKLPATFRSGFALPLLTLTLAGLPPAVTAAGDNDLREHSRGTNLMFNGRNQFRGNLSTGQHIYYAGDDLDISIRLSRGTLLLRDGVADVHIVIFSHDASLMSVPVGDELGSVPQRYFRIEDIDTSVLPEGQYQLALVLTVDGGDPALLDDWYGGFRALLDTEYVYISDRRISDDADEDGEWDDDLDNDGLNGEEDDDQDEDDKN